MMLKVIIVAIAIMAIGIAAEEFPADKPCTKEGAFDYYCHTCHCEKSGFGAACSKENCENKFNEDGTFTEEYKEMRKRLREEREKKEVEQSDDVEVPEEVDQKEFEQPEDDSMLDFVEKGYKKVKKNVGIVVENVGNLWG